MSKCTGCDPAEGFCAQCRGAEQRKLAEHYKRQRDFLLGALRGLPVQTGWCCCGSEVDKHGMGDGHSPVDEGDYSVLCIVQQIEKEDVAIGLT